MSNKRYEITITEQVQEETLTDREYKKINGEDYGYTEQVPTLANVTRTVYVQNIGDLDLSEVIKAVNGL